MEAALRQPNARKPILAAAIELLAEHGYGGASLKRVADRVGIRKASVFDYFDSKPDLAEQAFETVRQQLLDCLAPLVRDQGATCSRLADKRAAAVDVLMLSRCLAW